MPETKYQSAGFHESMQLVRYLGVNDPKFYALFATIGNKLNSYKSEHSGSLPKGFFLKLLELSGSYLCTEVILSDNHNNPVLKWRRDPTARAGEKMWENQLHIPGISVGSRRAEEMLPALLLKEVVKNKESLALLPKAELIGFGRLDEPERKTIADTCYWQIKLGKKHFELLQPDFEVVWSNKDHHIINQHKPVLDWWALGGNRPYVFDTREKR